MAKTRIIGLDIGTTHVRAAELEFSGGGPSRTSRPTLVRLGEVALPPGAVRDGEVVETSTVATAIRQLWSETKFSHRRVVIGIGNQRVIVRELDLPWMLPAQIRASLPFQVQDLLPVAVEDALLDFVPTGSYDGDNGRVLSGLLVAATKDTVRANTTAVEEAGLRPVMVDLSALALARIMARGESGERIVALVDVGARVTTVVISAQGSPRLVRVLRMGGEDATDAVSIALGVSTREAEQVKAQVGIGFAVPDDLRVAAEAVSSVTTSLVEAVRNTFVYYSSGHPGAAAELVQITGGGAQLPGFGQFLSSTCRMPVALGQPLDSLTVAPRANLPQAMAARQHVFAIPLGLAFGAAA